MVFGAKAPLPAEASQTQAIVNAYNPCCGILVDGAVFRSRDDAASTPGLGLPKLSPFCNPAVKTVPRSRRSCPRIFHVNRQMPSMTLNLGQGVQGFSNVSCTVVLDLRCHQKLAPIATFSMAATLVFTETRFPPTT